MSRAAGFKDSDRQPYLFTQNEYAAKRYLSDDRVTREGEVDMAVAMPAFIVKRVEYGLRLGLHATCNEYSACGRPVGAILTVYSGLKCLGYYAISYGG